MTKQKRYEIFSRFFSNHLSYKKAYFYILLSVLFIFMFKNPDIALMTFASIVFACSLCPLVDNLSNRMSRTKAAIIILSSIFIILATFLVPIFWLGARQMHSFAVDFPYHISNLDNTLKSIPVLNEFHIEQINIENLMDNISNKSSDIITNISNLLQELSSVFLYFFTAIIFIFFMLVDKDKIIEKILQLFPSEMRKKQNK